MEQNQVIVIESETKKKPIGLQVAALVFGIVGYVQAYIVFYVSFFGNALAVGLTETEYAQGSGIASGIVFGFDLVLALFCLAGTILGIVGLVRSIRRPTRTVKGIVLSAVGLSLSDGGLVLMIVAMIFGGVMRLLVASGAFH